MIWYDVLNQRLKLRLILRQRQIKSVSVVVSNHVDYWAIFCISLTWGVWSQAHRGTHGPCRTVSWSPPFCENKPGLHIAKSEGHGPSQGPGCKASRKCTEQKSADQIHFERCNVEPLLKHLVAHMDLHGLTHPVDRRIGWSFWFDFLKCCIWWPLVYNVSCFQFDLKTQTYAAQVLCGNWSATGRNADGIRCQ